MAPKENADGYGELGVMWNRLWPTSRYFHGIYAVRTPDSVGNRTGISRDSKLTLRL
jgi:hypothetical protein